MVFISNSSHKLFFYKIQIYLRFPITFFCRCAKMCLYMYIWINNSFQCFETFLHIYLTKNQKKKTDKFEALSFLKNFNGQCFSIDLNNKISIYTYISIHISVFFFTQIAFQTNVLKVHYAFKNSLKYKII